MGAIYNHDMNRDCGIKLYSILGLILFGALLLFSFSGEALCVKSPKALLRQGPGAQFPISWEVGKYMPLRVVERQGTWIKVKDLEGESHWVHRSSTTNAIECLVVRVNRASLWTKPAKQGARAMIPFADRYTPFKKLDRDEEWLQVQRPDGLTAWVAESHMWTPAASINLDF